VVVIPDFEETQVSVSESSSAASLTLGPCVLEETQLVDDIVEGVPGSSRDGGSSVGVSWKAFSVQPPHPKNKFKAMTCARLNELFNADVLRIPVPKAGAGPHATPGPLALELQMWPFRIIDVIASEGDTTSAITASPAFLEESPPLRRLVDNLNRIKQTSSYTGIDGMSTILDALIFALTQRGFHMIPLTPSEHACDNNHGVQEVLQKMRRPLSPKHIFGDIMDRLPPQRRQFLEAVPTPTSSSSEAIEEYYKRCQVVLQDPTSFPSTATSHCMVHGRDCPVASPGGPVNPRDELDITSGSSTCVEFSQMNYKRKGISSDQSTKPFFTWVWERTFRRESLALHECAASFPVEFFARPLLAVDTVYPDGEDPKYKVVSTVFGPEMLGWPYARPRALSMAISEQKLKWSGSMSEFHVWFGSRARSLDGHAFFVAGKQRVQQEIHRRSLRNYIFEGPEGRPPTWQDVTLPSHMVRLKDLRWDFYERQTTAGDDFMLTDLAQTAEWARSGVMCPTLLKASEVWSDTHDRCLLGEEHLFAHGYPTFQSMGWEMPFDVEGMTQATLKRLCGNGWHLEAVGSFLAYVLSQVFIPQVQFTIMCMHMFMPMRMHAYVYAYMHACTHECKRLGRSHVSACTCVLVFTAISYTPVDQLIVATVLHTCTVTQ
jgi:hypothetical protein